MRSDLDSLIAELRELAEYVHSGPMNTQPIISRMADKMLSAANELERRFLVTPSAAAIDAAIDAWYPELAGQKHIEPLLKVASEALRAAYAAERKETETRSNYDSTT